MRRFLAFFACVVALGAAETRSAETAPPARGIEMKEIEIRGELERPGVFYIIPRREVDLDLGPQTKDYRKEILTPLLPSEVEADDREKRVNGER